MARIRKEVEFFKAMYEPLLLRAGHKLTKMRVQSRELMTKLNKGMTKEQKAANVQKAIQVVWSVDDHTIRERTMRASASRNAKLSKAKRSKLASLAAKARWAKRKDRKD